MPVFIGHKPDTIFVYPILLMSLIGIISSLLAISGFLPAALRQADTGATGTVEFVARIVFLPLAAFAEEILNLLTVSFLYKKMKKLKKFRLVGSIISASIVFGIFHSFGWGLDAAILIGISYMPVFLATVYTGNIWVSFLAHLYNDLIAFTKAYYSGFHFIVIAAVTVIPALWAIMAMVRKTR